MHAQYKRSYEEETTLSAQETTLSAEETIYGGAQR